MFVRSKYDDAGELQRHRNDEVRQGLVGVNTMEDYTVIKQLAQGGQGATMLVKHNEGSANMVLKQSKVCRGVGWMRMSTRH